MNRVVLCGRLAERPCLSTTPTGLVVAALRLQVPRQGLAEPPHAMDEIDCIAFDELARALHRAGEPGLQVNLEGWLLSGSVPNEEPPRLVSRVAVEAAYWLDPREHAPVRVPAPAPPDLPATHAAPRGDVTRDRAPDPFLRVRPFRLWLRFPARNSHAAHG